MTPPAAVVVVAGTRPEFDTLAPVVRRLEASAGVTPVVVHTGQHYDDKLSDAFFRDLGLPEPDYDRAIGSGSHERQTAAVLEGVSEVLADHEPSVTVAQGDTNSTLGAALAASKHPTTFAHVEAGVNALVAPHELGARLDTLLSVPDARAAMTGAPDLYGDGTAAEQIVTVIEDLVAAPQQR